MLPRMGPRGGEHGGGDEMAKWTLSFQASEALRPWRTGVVGDWGSHQKNPCRSAVAAAEWGSIAHKEWGFFWKGTPCRRGIGWLCHPSMALTRRHVKGGVAPAGDVTEVVADVSHVIGVCRFGRFVTTSKPARATHVF
jgi:hypothetical protein